MCPVAELHRVARCGGLGHACRRRAADRTFARLVVVAILCRLVVHARFVADDSIRIVIVVPQY